MASATVFELPTTGPASQETHQLYAELFAAIPSHIDRIGSSVGDELPDVEHQVVIKTRYERASNYLGSLASSAAFSNVTGCWSVLKGRDNKGYVRLYSKNYPIPTHAGRNYGIPSHRLAYMLRLKEQGDSSAIPKAMEVDHVCRNTACCNPDHLRLADKLENNYLKLKAERFEKALAVGQMIIGKIGIDWFDEAVEAAEGPDTGLVISSRFGPHKIIKESHEPLISYAVREPCELYDALKPPSKRVEKRKSRAKRPFIAEGQLSFG